MFQFTRLLLTDLCIQSAAVGNPGITICLSTPPGFSQTSTPFILLMPRHPPCALGNLAVEIPNSATDSLPDRNPRTHLHQSRDVRFQVTETISHVVANHSTTACRKANCDVTIDNSHRTLLEFFVTKLDLNQGTRFKQI